MTVYFRTEAGDKLIKLGKVIKIETNKIGTFIVTGDYNEHTVVLKLCSDEETGQKTFNEIISRIVSPTANEIANGIIYIDLG